MIEESIRDVLRDQLLQEASLELPSWAKHLKDKTAKAWILRVMQDDPLIKKYYMAKTDAEAKKALDTLKSIRASSKQIPKVIKAKELVTSGKIK